MKLYCMACKQLQDVTYQITNKTYQVKELYITADVKDTFCSVCGSEIYDEAAEIENDKTFFNLYKAEKYKDI